jgi:hypothetical protein
LNFEELKLDAENLIRAGKRDAARDLLLQLKKVSIPRVRAGEFATLARRSGLLDLALQIMAPIIRPKTNSDTPATADELATYAVILLGLGASNEALEILKSADSNNTEINLALAFTYINRWDYASAIAHLKKYLALDGPSHYQRMIAKVNLAASYVAKREFEEGRALLAEISEETLANQWALLHKNSLELSAQLAILSANWSEAEIFLKRAAQEVELGFNLDDFFVRKWFAIMAILRDGPSASSLEALSKVRESAVANNHWETIRDCDYHFAISNQDEALAIRLYFGTPFARFRERIIQSSNSWLKVPKDYLWTMGGAEGDRRFDVRKGEEIGGSAKLKPGKDLHLALSFLVSDFYRPFLIGAFHSAVYPGEYFNPVSSPRRVSFLVHRLRAFLKESEIPVSLNVTADGYRLERVADYSFLLTEQVVETKDQDDVHYQIMLETLRESFTGKTFATAQVSSCLDISERSARYFLNWALEKKKLARNGTGRATRYKFGKR